MCGITGWIDWRRDLRKERATIVRMAESLYHRGPDEQNIWLTPNAAFGHARLIVVDPEGGRQPMQKTRNHAVYTLVYNGELYNTEELRKELLAKGYDFRGHSDTEVLLASYMEWKEACLERLNGIYAFAVWDESERKLFAARDRLGVKPFFYHVGNGYFLFGSEIKALLVHPEVKPVIGREGLAEIFGLGPSKTPGHGVYKGISELRPGHALTYTEAGVNVFRYWNVKSEVHADSVGDTVARVKALVLDAVRRQLYADVPVATFLSGGLDSSAISAIAAEYYRENGKGPLHTYSIDYEGNDQYFTANVFQPNADRDYVDWMSRFIGSVHHSEVIANEALVAALKRAVRLRDMPGYADVDASLLWFCERIKEEATVALSGECADEIFGGYPWFHKPETSAREGFPWMRSLDQRQALLNDVWRRRLRLKDYAYDRYLESAKETPLLDGEEERDAERRKLFYLNMNWFMTALLDRKDRMSMGASLEVRVPYADHRLVEYVWNIPWEIKMLNGREKGVLRAALEDVLPEVVLNRKKSPYPKTHHPAYTKAVSAWLKDVIARPSAPLLNLVDKGKIEDILESEGRSFKVPWFGQLMTGPQLIAHLAQINYWLETYGVDIDDR